MKRKITIGVSILVAFLLVWSVAIEPARLVVHHQKLSFPEWPEQLSPFKIAVVSDLHAGAPHIDVPKLQKIVRTVNHLQPDLVALLGDYVIHGVKLGRFLDPEVIARELRQLRARNGVVAVLGNHDWWYNGMRVKKALTNAGIVVLENETKRIGENGDLVWIVGLADYWTGQPDVSGTLKEIPETAAVIMLTHNPDIFPQIPDRVLLTLAGHTHGGQVSLPFIGPLIVPSDFGKQYAGGLIHESDHHLFVTTGIGTSIIPVRFGVPPEIAIITVTHRN